MPCASNFSFPSRQNEQITSATGCYGTSQTEAIRHMTGYVDKVLKGAKPGALPVETVSRYELIVNLKTARDIGVTIPPEVIKRANQVIQ